MQVPRAFGRAHVEQAPVQEVPQQTPSTQNPDLHWSPVVQSWPGPNLPQLPPSQAFGAAQSALVVHVCRQAPAAQVEGAQSMATPARQLPSPSQTLAGTSWGAPAQLDSLHTVPAAC